MTLDFSYKFFRTTADALQGMREGILGARESIYWEIYSLIDDETGAPFVELLCQKAKAGLEVKVIIDAIGSFELSRLSISRLRGAGVDVVCYNSLLPSLSLCGWVGSLWCRNHRKILVLDREVVFIGGVNVGDMYSKWDDLHVRTTGRIVTPLLRSFAKSYVHGGGDKKKIKHLLRPRIKKEWQDLKMRCKFFLHSPVKTKSSRAKNIFLNALSHAKTGFNLMTPYFVPDKNFFKMVSAAKERGVKVDLFLPLVPDYKFLEWVSGLYSKMAHKHGCNVYLSTKMNHGKAMTVDNQVGFVSSINFTHRSFFANEEAGILFHDEPMINDLNLIFEDLRQHGMFLSDKNYLHFGWKGRIKDWLGKQFGGFV
ncbi:MAG: phosphatidylserine/phosphatidylglycerophosphate/cardiolipin synthase family protein [Candidatus Magasanikbacteria bacterium]